MLLTAFSYIKLVSSVGQSGNSPSERDQTTAWGTCGLGLRRERDGPRRHGKWEAGHGKHRVRVNSINPSCLRRGHVHTYITDHVTWHSSSHSAHRVKIPTIYRDTVLGFPEDHCGVQLFVSHTEISHRWLITPLFKPVNWFWTVCSVCEDFKSCGRYCTSDNKTYLISVSEWSHCEEV